MIIFFYPYYGLNCLLLRNVPEDCFYLSKQCRPRIMRHFIWVFTVCQSTCLSVSRMKSVKDTYCAVWFCRVHSAFNKRKQPYVYGKPLLDAMASCHKPCQETNSFCCMLQVGTFIKLPFVIKSFVLSIIEWPFYTGFTVYSFLSKVLFRS